MYYTWTETRDTVDRLLETAEAIEIAGCTDDGIATERVQTEAEAQFFSVYVLTAHRCPTCGDVTAQAICVADRNTLPEAIACAANLATRPARPEPLPIEPFGKISATDPREACRTAE